VRKIAESYSQEQLAWIAVAQIVGFTDSGVVFSPARPRWRGRIARSLHLEMGRAPYSLSEDGVLFVWSTENQRRNLAPLWNSSPREMTRILRRHSHDFPPRLSHRLQSWIEAHIGLPVNSELVGVSLAKASRDLRVAQILLNRHRPRKIVIATQHNSLQRALALTARSAGIPTVYIPHAPTALTRVYRDIPFDYALLRGRKDKEFYEGLGANPSRITVIGDMSWSRRPKDATKPQPHYINRVVVAPSPWGSQRLKWFFAVIEDAGIGSYTVIPHPRSDLGQIHSLSSCHSQVVDNARTVQFLRANPAILIHGDSGVALEVMAEGLPSVSLTPANTPARYAFLKTDLVPRVSNAQELIATVGRLRATPPDTSELMNYASDWLDATGEAAADRARSFLTQRMETSAWVLDGWHSLLGDLSSR